MKLNIKKEGLISIVLIILVHSGFSQSGIETLRIQNKVKTIESLYNNQLENNPHLFNGIEYIQYSRNTEGHPFYLTEGPLIGTLNYSNQEYGRVPLQYDIFTDKLVVEHPFLSNSIQLIDEHVKSFTLEKRSFIRIADSAKVNISNGYYEVLYNGKSQALAKRKKTIVQKVKAGDLEVKFDESSRYYVLKNNKYFHVTTKNSLTAIFIDQKIQLRQYIKKNKLNFRTERELAIARVAAYYDELTAK